ncbi:MAG: phenylacetate--CoA ligase family protein [Deltaproteobacteria bacterium]|nr:phenylacetate--CoA ligase family protein [Deltaproteobacteria bacterium]
MWALADTLRALWRHPHATRDEIEAFRMRRLGALLVHAAARVPQYRDRFAAAGISDTRVRETRDLARFPITSKADLRAAPPATLLAAGTRPERLVRRITSGSTGEPFVIGRAPFEDHLLQLFRVRAWRQLGMRARDRRVSVAEPPLDGRRGGWPGPLRSWVGLFGNQYLDGLRAGSELLDRLERLCPEVISGYPSTLEQAAQSLDASPRRRIRPRLLVSGGEVLRPDARRTIEQAFRAPLFDLYGAHEFNLLAWQCPAGAGTFHVSDDALVLEVLGEDGRPVAEGESGEVVATNLHAFAMPFIRYRTGDRAVRGPATCPCGQPFTTLLAIDGRTMDHVVLPDGRRLHPFLLTGPLLEGEAGWIAQHQLEQRASDTLVLRLKPRGAASVEGVARLQARGARLAGPDMRLTIEIVDGFPVPRGRKFRP